MTVGITSFPFLVAALVNLSCQQYGVGLTFDTMGTYSMLCHVRGLVVFAVAFLDERSKTDTKGLSPSATCL